MQIARTHWLAGAGSTLLLGGALRAQYAAGTPPAPPPVPPPLGSTDVAPPLGSTDVALPSPEGARMPSSSGTGRRTARCASLAQPQGAASSPSVSGRRAVARCPRPRPNGSPFHPDAPGRVLEISPWTRTTTRRTYGEGEPMIPIDPTALTLWWAQMQFWLHCLHNVCC
jgi:hypothetical protein